MPPSNQFPGPETERVLPGIDPRNLNPAQVQPNPPGTFAIGGFTIQQYLPYVIISNGTASGYNLTFSMRTPGGSGGTFLVVLTGYSVVSIPTAVFQSVSGAVNSSIYYVYSDLPVLVLQGTVTTGLGSTESITDNAGNLMQPYQGGAAAPCSGVWHFMATISVASTALTVNTVSTLPIGTIASIASTSTLQMYEYAVVEGVTYTIAGGSVATSSGWIGPA